MRFNCTHPNVIGINNIGFVGKLIVSKYVAESINN